MAQRRDLLAGMSGALAAGLLARGSTAQAQAEARAADLAPTQAPEIVPLWPGAAPGGQGVTVEQRAVLRSPTAAPGDTAFYGVTRPTMALWRPARPNGAALLMIPGGSYLRVAMPEDGGGMARHLAGLGFTVGALVYRLPYDGWAAGPDAPLQDAQRAFRLLRRAVGPDMPTGVLGFSAGGHLAGSLATRFASSTYARLPDEDAAPPRPDFAGMMYPVVTMQEPHAHGESRKNLIGAAPDAERMRRWSLESGVPADAPPTFLSAAADDRVVPVENSLLMFQALRAAGVASALHVFDVGGHGFGSVEDESGPGHFWPRLFMDWLGRQVALSRSPFLTMRNEISHPGYTAGAG